MCEALLHSGAPDNWLIFQIGREVRGQQHDGCPTVEVGEGNKKKRWLWRMEEVEGSKGAAGTVRVLYSTGAQYGYRYCNRDEGGLPRDGGLTRWQCI